MALKAELMDMGYTHKLGPTGLLPVEPDQVHYFDNLVLIPSLLIPAPHADLRALL